MRWLWCVVIPLVGCDDGPLPVVRVGPACPELVARHVNDHWIATRDRTGGDQRWERATYFIGNLAAADTFGIASYLEYTESWADHHDYELNGAHTTSNADNHAAGQVFLSLYERTLDPTMKADVSAALDATIDSGDRGRWYWIDAQFMASPTYAQLGRITGDPRYTQVMFELFTHARDRRQLWDDSVGLWFRDENYLFPDAKTPNGQKIFWSRGNGWVIASLVRTLDQLPADSPYRTEYEQKLVAMSAALAKVQRSDGLWNVSLADPDDYPGPESSGTSFFTYAMAWGINQGVLPRDQYLPVVERAWRGLVMTAVREDGELGLVQGVGEAPCSSQPVTLRSTHDYGLGAFLLAATEVHQLGLDLECP